MTTRRRFLGMIAALPVAGSAWSVEATRVPQWDIDRAARLAYEIVHAFAGIPQRAVPLKFNIRVSGSSAAVFEEFAEKLNVARMRKMVEQIHGIQMVAFGREFAEPCGCRYDTRTRAVTYQCPAHRGVEYRPALETICPSCGGKSVGPCRKEACRGRER